MRSIKWVLIFLCLAGGLYWGFRVLFPDEKQVIRRQLHEFAEAATIAPETSQFSRLAKAMKISSGLTPDIQVEAHLPDHVVDRRGEDVHSLVKSWLASPGTRNVDLKFYDIEVSLSPDASEAQIKLTAVMDYNEQSPYLAQECLLEMVKIEGDWKIKQVETISAYTR